jgi:hypothetical protein
MSTRATHHPLLLLLLLLLLVAACLQLCGLLLEEHLLLLQRQHVRLQAGHAARPACTSTNTSLSPSGTSHEGQP